MCVCLFKCVCWVGVSFSRSHQFVEAFKYIERYYQCCVASSPNAFLPETNRTNELIQDS